MGIGDQLAQSRPFVPHITVAFRDLTPTNFKAAWAEFEARQVDFEFTADRLTLLVHDGRRWQVKSEFGFRLPEICDFVPQFC